MVRVQSAAASGAIQLSPARHLQVLITGQRNPRSKRRHRVSKRCKRLIAGHQASLRLGCLRCLQDGEFCLARLFCQIRDGNRICSVKGLPGVLYGFLRLLRGHLFGKPFTRVGGSIQLVILRKR